MIVVSATSYVKSDGHGHHGHRHNGYRPYYAYERDSTGHAPEPSYGAPAPSYGAPAPSYDAPAPSYGAPAPSYDAPAPSYDTPSTGYDTPSTGYDTPSTGTFFSLINIIVLNIGLDLKVSKNRNGFMKTLFLPKSNAIILRNSAVYYTGQKFLK